jgi:hypothetical protein
VTTPSTAGQKSGHVLGDEAPGRQGATRAHSRSYVTEEQRSRPGWIGSQNVPEILNGGTSYEEDVNDRDPEIMLAKAELARTRADVATSVMALHREISRAFDWREWVIRRPIKAVMFAFAVGALLGLIRVGVQQERK